MITRAVAAEQPGAPTWSCRGSQDVSDLTGIQPEVREAADLVFD
jgi:hypothetical protein